MIILSVKLFTRYELMWLEIEILTMKRLEIKPGRRPMNSNFLGTKVSRLMLTLSNPAFIKSGKCLESVTPFVVSATVSIPSRSFNFPKTKCVRS